MIKSTFKTVSFLSIFFLFAFSSIALASPKALVSVEKNPGIDSAYLSTVEVLTRGELTKYNIQVVVPNSATSQPVSKLTLARSLSAQFLYKVSLLPMGRKVIFNVQMIDVASGNIIRSRTATSMGLEELDVVVPRVVGALVKNEDLEANQKINTITKTEARKFRKKAGESFWGVGISTGFNMSKDTQSLVGFSFDYIYEMQRARFGAEFATLFSDDIQVFSGNIVAHYLFSDGNISPFIGGGMGFTVMNYDDDQTYYDEKEGVSFLISGGVELFRFYETRLVAQIDIQLPIFQIEEDQWSVLEGDSTKKSWIPTAAFKLKVFF